MENIFSLKKATEHISKNTIQIDFREKNSLVPSELRGMNQKIIFTELKVGDYIVNNTIIERKEINDLVSSIKDKRIFEQIKNMKQYSNSIIIIEGNIYSQKSLHPNAIKGFILSTCLHKKIPLIFSSNPKETARYIQILNEKKQKSKSLIPSKKRKTKHENQKYILESFEGIGPKNSKKLLEKYNTLKEIFNSPKKELEKTLNKRTISFLKQLN